MDALDWLVIAAATVALIVLITWLVNGQPQTTPPDPS